MIAEVLAQHMPTARSGTRVSVGGNANLRYCSCGLEVEVRHDELDDDEVSADARLNAKLAEHQGNMVVAALAREGLVEYAVRWDDGEIECTGDRDFLIDECLSGVRDPDDEVPHLARRFVTSWERERA